MPTDKIEQKIKQKRTALNQKWFKAVLFAYQWNTNGKAFHLNKSILDPSNNLSRQLAEAILKYEIVIEQNSDQKQVYVQITDTDCGMPLILRFANLLKQFNHRRKYTG